MKIIAKINSDTVLVEMNKREIARLHGQSYDYTKFNEKWMEVGGEFPIEEVVSVLDAVRNLDSRKIDSIKIDMERALATVAQCKINLEALTLLDKLAE